ncbi:MAG: intradiol ring-cleavage dioxygenase [Betaproteobacteria bacterium]
MTISRRVLLGAALALPFAARGQTGCGAPTEADIEGPFYKAGAPLRANLVDPGSTADKMVLTGIVLAANCKPLAGVSLDFWHADDKGEYDGTGYRYRGIVTTDYQGRYRLETNMPPPYSGRPRHIHVKLQRPGGRVLTTQLYFPGESRDAPRVLVMKMERRAQGRLASFDFIL